MSTDRRSRADTAADTAARLVAAGRRAFADQGFAAVSLDALAAEAGVTRGALHHRFGDKRGLFEAVLRQVDAEISARLDALHAAEPDPWIAFRRSCLAYLDEALAPDRRRILFHEAAAVLGLAGVDLLLESGLAPLIQDLRDLTARGLLPPLDPEATAQALNAAILQLAWWAAEGGEDRLPRARDTLARLLDALPQPPRAPA
jgi:AcrR family transcriptional regulator